ncbi:MAG: response regulator [Ignavibacteriae bacterium]|nr:MAG: response regulator [Ignavibacteriota bacterium]
MKILIVDDNENFVRNVIYKIKETEYYKNASKIFDVDINYEHIYVNTFYELKNRITYAIENDNTIILINANVILKDYRRQDMAGIEILYYLRLERRLNSILIYSFESIKDIIRKSPYNIIALTKYTYHLRLPIKTEELNNLFNQISNEPQIKLFEDYRPFLLIDTIKQKFETQDKHELANKLGALNWANAFFETKDIVELESMKILLKSKQKNILEKDFHKYMLLLSLTNSENQYMLNYIGERDKISSLFESFSKESKRNFKILFVDDHCEDGGWSCLLEKVFGKSCDLTSVPSAFEAYEKMGLKENKKLLIDYDLVILDLNLDKDPSSTPIKQRSGYKVLEFIRDCDKSIPVIIFTASEKANNILELENIGINGYLCKTIYGDKTLDEVEKLYNIINITIENIYIRNIWKCFIDFENKTRFVNNNWEGNELAFNSTVNMLFKLFELLLLKTRNFRKSDKIFDQFIINAFMIFDNIFLKELYDIDVSTIGRKKEKLFTKDDRYGPFGNYINYINVIRNNIVHNNYEANIYDMLLDAAVLMYILTLNPEYYFRVFLNYKDGQNSLDGLYNSSLIKSINLYHKENEKVKLNTSLSNDKRRMYINFLCGYRNSIYIDVKNENWKYKWIFETELFRANNPLKYIWHDYIIKKITNCEIVLEPVSIME